MGILLPIALVILVSCDPKVGDLGLLGARSVGPTKQKLNIKNYVSCKCAKEMTYLSYNETFTCLHCDLVLVHCLHQHL
jgi:hypothetical protein